MHRRSITDELGAVKQRIQNEPLITEFANREPASAQIAYEGRAMSTQVSLKKIDFQIFNKIKTHIGSPRMHKICGFAKGTTFKFHFFTSFMFCDAPWKKTMTYQYFPQENKKNTHRFTII
jgi:hypothetical protein